MRAKLLLASLLVLAFLGLWAGSSARAQQSSGGGPNIAPDDPRLFPDLADPNDPRRLSGRKTITPRAREDRGLAPRDWTGVVHPQVLPTLERIDRTLQEAKRRKSIEAVQIISAVRFPEKVFVQVQLHHAQQGARASAENKAALKVVQRRVLTSLKASEFHVQYLFETHPGIVGYVSREGLAKLGANQDVAGVCLDQEPLAWSRTIITGEDLPPAAADEAANEPGVAERKVERDVYRAFALTDRLHVTFALDRESLPRLNRAELAERLELRERAERLLVDRILSTLTADDFWREGSKGILVGRLTREGLDKVWNHPDVLMIGLPGRAKLAIGVAAEP